MSLEQVELTGHREQVNPLQTLRLREVRVVQLQAGLPPRSIQTESCSECSAYDLALGIFVGSSSQDQGIGNAYLDSAAVDLRIIERHSGFEALVSQDDLDQFTDRMSRKQPGLERNSQTQRGGNWIRLVRVRELEIVLDKPVANDARP